MFRLYNVFMPPLASRLGINTIYTKPKLAPVNRDRPYTRSTKGVRPRGPTTSALGVNGKRAQFKDDGGVGPRRIHAQPQRVGCNLPRDYPKETNEPRISFVLRFFLPRLTFTLIGNDNKVSACSI